MELYIKPTDGPVFSLETMGVGTVHELKERIKERTGIPAPDQTLLFNGQILPDDGVVPFLGIDDYRLIQLEVRNPPSKSTPVKVTVVKDESGLDESGGESGIGGGSGKLTVKVLPWESDRTVSIEVDKKDKVGMLRRYLEWWEVLEGFELPSEYFFIHKQRVMVDDKTFEWHGVEYGDDVEVFRGKAGARVISYHFK